MATLVGDEMVFAVVDENKCSKPNCVILCQNIPKYTAKFGNQNASSFPQVARISKSRYSKRRNIEKEILCNCGSRKNLNIAKAIRPRTLPTLIRSYEEGDKGPFFPLELSEMKFYRMDSDQPDWEIWSRVYDEVGRRDFVLAKALFNDLYASIAKQYKGNSDTHEINIRKLAESLRISRRKAAQMTLKLGPIFAFEPRIVRRYADETPQIVQIYYPKFLEKQKSYSKRGGESKRESKRESKSNREREREENIPPALLEEIWTSYSDAFKYSYGVTPLRTEEADACVKELASREREHAPGIARLYVTTPRKFWVSMVHNLKYCLEDLDQIHTEYFQRLKLSSEQAHG